MVRTFKSAVDWWYYLLIVVVVATVLIAAYITPDPDEQMAALVVGLLGASLPVWLLYSTFYVIDSRELRIQSGPFRWTIALEDISSVKPSRSTLSGPALSLNRLRIDYGAGKWVLVSPEQPDEFISALGRE